LGGGLIPAAKDGPSRWTPVQATTIAIAITIAVPSAVSFAVPAVVSFAVPKANS